MVKYEQDEVRAMIHEAIAKTTLNVGTYYCTLGHIMPEQSHGSHRTFDEWTAILNEKADEEFFGIKPQPKAAQTTPTVTTTEQSPSIPAVIFESTVGKVKDVVVGGIKKHILGIKEETTESKESANQ